MDESICISLYLRVCLVFLSGPFHLSKCKYGKKIMLNSHRKGRHQKMLFKDSHQTTCSTLRSLRSLWASRSNIASLSFGAYHTKSVYQITNSLKTRIEWKSFAVETNTAEPLFRISKSHFMRCRNKTKSVLDSRPSVNRNAANKILTSRAGWSWWPFDYSSRELVSFECSG